MRDFLWKGSSGRGYAKVAWVNVCKSKEEGGLGIRSILHMNQALMLKHVWRVLQEDPRSIWVAWVLRYRLSKHTIWTQNTSSATWCWKKLIKVSRLLQPGMEYRVGDGCKFTLWTDLWHPRGPLIHSYPRGPSITGLPADSKLAVVVQDGQWKWPAEYDFDIQEIIAALPPIHQHQSDMIQWRTGKFTTAAVLSLIQPPSPRVPWYHLLGGKFKIPRHNFILWLAILERLSTMDRSWVQHRLAHVFFVGNNVIWASKRWRGSNLINAAYRALLAAIVYLVWRERNNRRFSAIASPAESIAARALEEIRCRIISANLRPSLQSLTLYRIWRIPWDRNSSL
ncbi:UNVERIFIED_CONTAM: hypothetical protein Sradi_6917800 [Sesamum radiatum]|uniref:Reverse transcriptase zinc-binding domain-containing protein n=1 Tax=Sesamum radiatum TaxID=300843 RepID=A0AAW2JJR7_SESRA